MAQDGNRGVWAERPTGADPSGTRSVKRARNAASPASQKNGRQKSGSGNNKSGAGKTPEKTATKQQKATKQQRAQKQKAKGLKRNKRRQKGLGQYLQMPDLQGPKVSIGLLWFVAAVGSVLAGRWATTALWAVLAGFAAYQVTKAWDTGESAGPPFAQVSAGIGAALIVVCAGIGTSLGGLALIGVPLLIVVLHVMLGLRPGDAGGALIGTILAAIASGSVVLVARETTWAALFLVMAVSLYDAGYFIGAAESASRIEGPITGMIGVLAVTFAAGAVQAEPFDMTTAWTAGGLMAIACPFGQMITSAFLPDRETPAPAMRRLDAYLVAAPMMFASVLAIG